MVAPVTSCSHELWQLSKNLLNYNLFAVTYIDILQWHKYELNIVIKFPIIMEQVIFYLFGNNLCKTLCCIKVWKIKLPFSFKNHWRKWNIVVINLVFTSRPADISMAERCFEQATGDISFVREHVESVLCGCSCVHLRKHTRNITENSGSVSLGK